MTVILVALAHLYSNSLFDPAMFERSGDLTLPHAIQVRWPLSQESQRPVQFRHSSPNAALLPNPQQYVEDPVTNLSIELKLQQVRLEEVKMQQTEASPVVGLQLDRVAYLKQAVDELEDQGILANADLLRRELQTRLALAKAELSLGRKVYEPENPSLSLLQQRVDAITLVVEALP